jgi:hypothetical protein
MGAATVNLAELRTKFGDSQFRELIQHHLSRMSHTERIGGFQGTVAMLPEAARPLVEGFLNRWNPRIHDKAFWERETATVFDEIIEDARSVLRPLGLAADDEAAFNMFNTVVLNYAYSAYDQPMMRELMGISDTAFPWPSALGLLFPVSATTYIATVTPAPPAMVMGYGLANLGYLLFGAGIWAGSFRIFGLRKRWQVLTLAVASFLLGTALVKI